MIPDPTPVSGTVQSLFFPEITSWVVQSSASSGLAVTIGNQATLGDYGSRLGIWNLGCRTGQLYLNDYTTVQAPASYVFEANIAVSGASTGTQITFTDDGTTGTDIYKYSQIDYLSNQQSVYNTIYVEAEGVTTQSALANIFATGSLVYQSANSNAAGALNLATYLASTLAEAVPTPFAITTSTAVDGNAQKLAEYVTYPIGSTVKVIFRGSTIYATLQGSSCSFYPDYATFTCYLSPSLGTPFILDSTAFGVLDTNRLGYP